MGSKITWSILAIVALLLGVLFLSQPRVQLAGDMPEYYGMTESLLSHGNINLTSEDLSSLERNFVPEHFRYYIPGLDGNRYPVHFIFYSILATPVRFALHLFQVNELKTLMLTNLLIFSIIIAVILKYFSLPNFQKGALLLLLFLSPLAFFIAWPGPDICYVLILLVSIFLFYAKRYFWASVLAAFASWHSQPLFILALGFLALYVYSEIVKTIGGKRRLVISFNILWESLIPIILVGIPYALNFLVFGVATPWTLLQDGWTQVYGFGLQNVSLKRLFEMFFDLNMGLFWYAPLILVGGSFYFFKSFLTDKRNIFILVLILLTAFSYQTNPAWHFGTAGYGPSRHVIFVLPFLIYFLVKNAKQSAGFITLLLFIIVSQLGVLSLNGWFLPNWENSLNNSPVARFVLNRYPVLYNPTPEIFVDRTNHTDLGFITTAIYKNDQGICRKAYVLITDREKVEKECGKIPEKYENKFDNDLLRKASFSRSVWTIEATFWPDPVSCGDNYVSSSAQPYQCLKTLDDVVKFTGVKDVNRVKELGRGIWQLQSGLPVKVIVPPGYTLRHYSFDGIYINYD